MPVKRQRGRPRKYPIQSPPNENIEKTQIKDQLEISGNCEGSLYEYSEDETHDTNEDKSGNENIMQEKSETQAINE